jgi:hypothetical protein
LPRRQMALVVQRDELLASPHCQAHRSGSRQPGE